MSIVSEQRIQHFDRPVRHQNMKGLRRQQLRAAIKERRGGPSGSHSPEYVFDSMEVRLLERNGEDVTKRKARLALMRLRERMLERSLRARARAARARRPSVLDTKINFARRQRDFIMAQAAQQEAWNAIEEAHELA
jgi:hypothetical protein